MRWRPELHKAGCVFTFLPGRSRCLGRLSVCPRATRERQGDALAGTAARSEGESPKSRQLAEPDHGLWVLAIVAAEFWSVSNLVSRIQQTGDPEEVQGQITKKYIGLSAEELQRLLAPEEGKPLKHQLNQAHVFDV